MAGCARGSKTAARASPALGVEDPPSSERASTRRWRSWTESARGRSIRAVGRAYAELAEVTSQLAGAVERTSSGLDRVGVFGGGVRVGVARHHDRSGQAGRCVAACSSSARGHANQNGQRAGLPAHRPGPGDAHEAGPRAFRGARRGRLEPLTEPASWSPDRRELAFARITSGTFRGTCGFPYRHTDIFVVNADGAGLHRVTRTNDAVAPMWSPDDREIVFARRSCTSRCPTARRSRRAFGRSVRTAPRCDNSHQRSRGRQTNLDRSRQTGAGSRLCGRFRLLRSGRSRRAPTLCTCSTW